MKYWFLLIFTAFPLLSSCLGNNAVPDTDYIPGIYEGIGSGYRGPVHVEVQLGPAGIEDIIIVGHSDSIYPGETAMEELLDLVLEYGSTDLDSVAGATFSSRGFLKAVENALEQGRS